MELLTIHKGDTHFNTYIRYINGQGASICGALVSHTYVKRNAIENADMIVVSLTKKRTRTGERINLHGFALIRTKKSALYVDVICAKGVGKKILQRVYENAQHMGKRFITLSALPHVIHFYRKEGFIHSENACVEHDNIKRVARESAHMRFKTNNQAITNESFRKLLLILIKHGLVSDKSCREINVCKDNGFLMTKCL